MRVDNEVRRIDFKEMVASKTENGKDTKVQIERTKKNNKKRPNSEQRFQGSSDQLEADRMDLENLKDLEYLGWNWRLDKLIQDFGSRKRMVFENFNRSVPMLPTPNDIVFGFILAQVE